MGKANGVPAGGVAARRTDPIRLPEDDLIAWLRGQPGTRGLGDDCAILPAPARGRELILKCDQFVENVHFRQSTYRPRQAGKAALARALSDLAATGATPHWCLLSLAFPSDHMRWMQGFLGGLLELAREERVELVGGDLARGDTIAATVFVAGSAPRGKSLRRSGAQPGDGIFVSGVLGAAAVALRRQEARIPQPRLELGRYLRSRATACMDISDGLSLDLHRLCRESVVAAEIDRPLPLAVSATDRDAWVGGEDYELLFTAASAPRVYRGVAITRIGTIVRGKPGDMTWNGRRRLPVGYDHFLRPIRT